MQKFLLWLIVALSLNHFVKFEKVTRMSFFSKRNIFSFLFPLAVSANAFSLTPLQQSLNDNLDFMHSVYKSMYAPVDWKKSHLNWDLDEQIALAKQKGESNPNLTFAESRDIVKEFIDSMQDYHVSIAFHATEKAVLPFVVRGAGEKVFIVYIDRTKLSETAFPFHVGDELVTFGNVPALQAVTDLQAQTAANVPETDRALAEMELTKRSAARGMKVPKGQIVLGIRAKGTSNVTNIQLIWDYTPEVVKEPTFPLLSEAPLSASSAAVSSSFLHPMMSFDVSGMQNAEKNSETPYDLGVRKTFTPDLGTKIWESSSSDPFYAYIFKGEDRRLLGYIRLPSYVPENSVDAAKAFGKIMTMFETATDGLVIDQVNNPGGSVFYLYALVSMLTGQTIVTPQHEMSLSQDEVLQASNSLQQIQDIKTDEDAKALFPTGLEGYPASYETVLFLKSYLQFLVDSWNAGQHRTAPYWVYGVDHINPNPTGHYTKPILLLINALDFSGGDFFPAILQDNKRVTILGERTSGAGGYVNNVAYPNNLGISYVRVTESIAHRIDSNPIENLGVQPDIEYRMTEDDFTNNYTPYVKKIQETINGMVR